MRDSHELYDYESTNMRRKQFDINQSSKSFCLTYSHSWLHSQRRRSDNSDRKGFAI